MWFAKISCALGSRFDCPRRHSLFWAAQFVLTVRSCPVVPFVNRSDKQPSACTSELEGYGELSLRTADHTVISKPEFLFRASHSVTLVTPPGCWNLMKISRVCVSARHPVSTASNCADVANLANAAPSRITEAGSSARTCTSTG